MAKFKFPKRYDKDVASAGIKFDIHDEFGNHYGRFLTRYLNGNDPKYQLIRTRLDRTHALAVKTKQMTDDDVFALAFVEYAIIGWEDVFGEDGEPVEFSLEAAKEYFAEPDAKFVLGQLISNSLNVEFYQASTPEEAKKK
ncbi:hypothetical protein JQK15_13615 [Sphingobium sp. BHU LFT2]|uniref:hypothetical protein n=1 Tax=Sphingobium sp. BHU LFT2 TaxID=2807634 RepID=UPI001BEC90D9|nr:hypothetical protein [Sphingobium sp. BHU LFT2]MBT2244577.1 hypothetical protein [Sphingobium sp. BHU LFT2]